MRSIPAFGLSAACLLTLACGGGASSSPTPGPSAPAAPTITTQPADLSVAVNQSPQFTVASGTAGATYQWKRGGVPITGATSPSYGFSFATAADDQAAFSVDVMAAGLTTTSRTARLTVSPLAVVPFTYTSFNGSVLNLFAWEGKYTTVLSRGNTLPVADMTAILDATDATYQYYKAATGFTPSPAKLYHGKLTLADVPATCGAGCGYLGATGIELQNTYFDILTTGVHDHAQFDQVFFYEFGRNFWHLGSQLEYLGPDNTSTITTGFAVFMRFMAMDAAAVAGGPYGAWTYADFRARVEAMIDLYLADGTQTWATTLKLGHAQANNPSGLGATDLFASFCFRLRRDQGGDAFIQKLWIEAAKRPTAATTQDAVDNFFLAACAAGNKNLTTLFETTWRWPLSAAAKTAASAYPN